MAPVHVPIFLDSEYNNKIDTLVRYIFIIVSILLALVSYGQADTVDIDEVVITPLPTRNIITGSITEEWNDEKATVSLGELLTQKSNVYIKSYGPGSLSTPSIRGGSASQVLVLWNGIPLQSPTLGLLDLSLVPTASAETISLQKGGNSSLWGSGAVSGLLSLKSKAPSKKGYASSSTIGSFGHLSQQLRLDLKEKNISTTTKYIHESSDRDFTFERSANLPIEQLSNAKYYRNHFLQDIYFDASQHHKVGLHFWIYKARTYIPPHLAQTNSDAYQDDSAFRSIIDYAYVRNKSIIKAKVGYFKDHNDYYDSRSSIEARNVFTTTTAELTYHEELENQTVTLGTTYLQTEATTDGYPDGVTESKVAFFGAHGMQQNRWQIKSSLRLERVEKQFQILPVVAGNFNLLPWLGLRTKVSRDYRLPTLNDRYWSPGGDDGLLAESGWSQEIGTDFRGGKRTWNIAYSITAFNRNINNWILWTPGDGVPFWTAKNINEVWSRGLEQSFVFDFTARQFTFDFGGSYDYILSTYEETLTLPKVEKGDQLIYTPVHQGKLTGAIKYSNYKLNYTQQFTGSASAVNEMLPAFSVANLGLGFESQLLDHDFDINFQIRNVWDADYFIQERRPMPGRHYNIQLTINFYK